MAAKKVSFDDITLMEQLFAQLSEESGDGSVCPFRDWEILHELDRQQRRREYDKSPARMEQRRKEIEKREEVRKYLAEHPEEEQRLMNKIHIGLSRQ